MKISESPMMINSAMLNSTRQARYTEKTPVRHTKEIPEINCLPSRNSLEPIRSIKPLSRKKSKKRTKRKTCKSCGLSICTCSMIEDYKSDVSLEESQEILHVPSKKYNDFTYMLHPLYEGRQPTLLFDYPPQCLLESRISARVYILNQAKSLTFKFSNGAFKYNCIVNSLSYAGFSQTSTARYNVHITNVPKPDVLRDMYPYQKINHFPGIWQLGRKDCMWRNYYSQKRKFRDSYDFCPKTFILPEDLPRLEMEREKHPKVLWILKPAAAACGQGIKVLSANSSISKKQGYLVQKYIDSPHTIRGFKYDLRIYVCVTSFDPLRVYIYEDGLVRFATEMYSTNKKKIKKRYVHLTNFSVNKKSAGFVKNRNPYAENVGSKWSLNALRRYFEEKNIDHCQVFERIEDVIIKTLISVEPHVVNAMNQGNKSRNLCFEVYGFDIIIDSYLKPWLLEVNVLPSLSSSSPLDKRIKTSLMCDVFTLIGIVPFDRKALDKQIEQDKVTRLLGIDRAAKTAHRNLNALQSCGKLEDFALSEEDLQVILDHEEEGHRTGRFKRIFPTPSNIDYYYEMFQVPRYNNLLIKKYLSSQGILSNYVQMERPRINI